MKRKNSQLRKSIESALLKAAQIVVTKDQDGKSSQLGKGSWRNSSEFIVRQIPAIGIYYHANLP